MSVRLMLRSSAAKPPRQKSPEPAQPATLLSYHMQTVESENGFLVVPMLGGSTIAVS